MALPLFVYKEHSGVIRKKLRFTGNYEHNFRYWAASQVWRLDGKEIKNSYTFKTFLLINVNFPATTS